VKWEGSDHQFSISEFPALSSIAGDVYVKSSQPLDCTPLQQLSSEGKVAGTFFCAGGTSASTPSATTGALGTPTASTSSQTTVSSSGLSAGAVGGIAAGVAVVVVVLLGAIIFFCLRSRKKRRIEELPQQYPKESDRNIPPDSAVASTKTPTLPISHELEVTQSNERLELEAPPNHAHELGGTQV
jgi:hypothetical protein